MTKAKIIVLSIILFIATLLAILFGVVFRLRQIDVEFVGENTTAITKAEIVDSAKQKYGDSIFMLNKEKAENNIEKTFSQLKVIQIKTTSINSITIKVRQRHQTYYAVCNTSYFILDEELKILEITDVCPLNLIEIKTELGITENNKVCDFVGNKEIRLATYNLLVAMLTTVKTQDAQPRFLEREDVSDYLTEISFANGYTTTEKYNRLIIKASYGVVLDIAKPEQQLSRKINTCFATINALTVEQRTHGTIKISIDNEGNEISGYID